jgi:hypothetical protein
MIQDKLNSGRKIPSLEKRPDINIVKTGLASGVA